MLNQRTQLQRTTRRLLPRQRPPTFRRPTLRRLTTIRLLGTLPLTLTLPQKQLPLTTPQLTKLSPTLIWRPLLRTTTISTPQ